MRVGIGYDIHALKKDRKLLLGGIHIPHPKGLAGHSDGDALLHAVVDAMLGAAGAGDIGDFFPDTDTKNKNANSQIFIKKALDVIKQKGFVLNNVDATVIAEKPKLSAYKDKMQKNLATLLHLKPSQVNVKAKTNEGFGPIGKHKAIACFAIASLSKNKPF